MSLEDLQKENAALKAKLAVKSKITLKVGVKGGASLYGLGRYPVTLYKGQWERLIEPETIALIKTFLAANAAALKEKE